MTTSGLGSWLPTIGEIIDEALEYAGIDPASANARHLKSAMRSLNQVYLWLENDREALFRDDIETVSIKAGQAYFFAPPGTLSVKKGMIRSVGQPAAYANNIEVFPKAVWFDMPSKSQVGQPSIMALNYSAPVTPDHLYTDTEKLLDEPSSEGTFSDGGYGGQDWAAPPAEGMAYTPGTGPQVILWPIPDRDYTLDFIRVRETQKATQLGQHADARRIWVLAITFKLAHFLAVKYNFKKANYLEGMANEELAKTNMNNRETADINMTATSFSLIRPGRRFR